MMHAWNFVYELPARKIAMCVGINKNMKVSCVKCHASLTFIFQLKLG